MKKGISALALAFALAAACVAGCGTGETPTTSVPPATTNTTAAPHTHTYEERWSYDGTTHWHQATCEHIDERGDEGAHVFTDGVCDVCGYRIVGMPTEEFIELYAQTARAFAQSGRNKPADPDRVVSDFVWFVTDSDNKVIEMTYLFTERNGEAAIAEGQPTHTVRYVTVKDLFVDLKDVAEGTATAESGYNIAAQDFYYDKDETEANRALADAAYDAYAAYYGAEEGEPILRLFRRDYAEGKQYLQVFDLKEDGYVVYQLRIVAAEDVTNEALIALLGEADNIDSHRVERRTFDGTLVYKSIGD